MGMCQWHCLQLVWRLSGPKEPKEVILKTRRHQEVRCAEEIRSMISKSYNVLHEHETMGRGRMHISQVIVVFFYYWCQRDEYSSYDYLCLHSIHRYSVNDDLKYS